MQYIIKVLKRKVYRFIRFRLFFLYLGGLLRRNNRRYETLVHNLAKYSGGSRRRCRRCLFPSTVPVPVPVLLAFSNYLLYSSSSSSIFIIIIFSIVIFYFNT